MDIQFRAGQPGDAAAAVPLIYSSGPAAFDYVFKVPGRADAQEFLHRAFIDGRGEFGFQNHVVGLVDGVIVAAGAAWDGRTSLAFMRAAVAQILACYGVAGLPVLARGLRVEQVVQPPRRDCWYVAHLGVQPECRGRGYGERLVAHLLHRGIALGHRLAALDVSVENPRAQLLYERIGFKVARELVSTLANAQATVPNHRRMEIDLARA